MPAAALDPGDRLDLDAPGLTRRAAHDLRALFDSRGAAKLGYIDSHELRVDLLGGFHAVLAIAVADPLAVDGQCVPDSFGRERAGRVQRRSKQRDSEAGSHVHGSPHYSRFCRRSAR